MSSIGTAYKTIFTRMSNIKAGVLEYVDEDGTEQTLSDVETILNNVGISLRDSDSEFRNFGDVIDEVATKWDSYSSVTQAAIAKAFAGTRQQEYFRVLMENYDTASEYAQISADSAGTAEEKYSAYLDSITAKTESLKAALESLASSTISTDMYGGILDAATSMTNLVDETGILKGALAGLGSAGTVYIFQQLSGWIQGAVQEFSNLSAAMNLVKTTTTFDDSTFENLVNLASGLSKSQTNLILTSTSLSDAQRVQILMAQGVSEAEATAQVASLGLATAEGTAAAATVSFSSVLSGLWSTLLANPLILVAAGVAAGVTAWNAYNNSVKEAVSSAQEAGNSYEESTSSIEDYISQIKELRSALAEGNLTEEEAYNKKSELLSIQESLVDTYGSQASGIDLVNGSLEDQISLLNDLSASDANEFLNENRKGINKATSEMEKDIYQYLGQYASGTEEGEKLQEIIDKYADEGLYTSIDENTGLIQISFKGDASQAEETLNGFATDVRELEGELGESNLLEGIQTNASTGLEKANEILDEYEDLYNQALQAQLTTDTEMFSVGDESNTAIEWMNQYTEAVEVYNDALSSGDTSEIQTAKEEFESVDNAVSTLLSDSDMGAYSSFFDDIRDQLDETTIALTDFQAEVENSDYAEQLKELELSDVDVKYALETDGVQEGEEAIQALAQAAEEAGIDTDTFIDTLITLGIISGEVSAEVETTTDSLSSLSSATSSVLDEIDSINELVQGQAAGTSISAEDYSSWTDYQDAIENVNGSLQLNAEKVQEITKAKAEEAIANNETAKAQAQLQYAENAQQIVNLRDELNKYTKGSEECLAIKSEIKALRSDNSEIEAECTQYDLLSQSLREATSEYQNWLNAQNESQSGDMFDDTKSMWEAIQEVNDTDSENYGKVGATTYQAAVDFLVPDDVDSEDQDAVNSYLDSIQDYFEFDDDGNMEGIDLSNFLSEAVDQGLMEIEDGEYKIAGEQTIEEFADGMNLSLPMVQACIGELNEYIQDSDSKITFADDNEQSLEDMAVAASDAAVQLEKLDGFDQYDLVFDVSDIEDSEEQIKALDNTIEALQAGKTELDLDDSDIENANTLIAYCVAQKQQLEEPVIMSVDASDVEDTGLSEALSLLQEYQAAQDSYEINVAIGADTTESEQAIQDALSGLSNLDDDVKATLGIDFDIDSESSSEAIEEAKSQVNSVIEANNDTATFTATFGVDSSAVEEYQSTNVDKTATVTYSVNHTDVDSYDPQNKYRTVYYTVQTVGSISGVNGASGTAHANGTAIGKSYPNGAAFVNGTAKLKGDWGLDSGQRVLIGELGREIVVDPRSGRWRTYGDNGAEFADIPKDAIIFNHLQTESLLNQGFVSSRGTAMAAGTACTTLSGGGIKTSTVTKSSGSSSSSSSGSGSSGSSNSSGSSSSNKSSSDNSSDKETKTALEKFQEWFGKLFDWIEIKLERQTDKISRYITKAESALDNGNYSNSAKYYQKAINTSANQMSTYDTAESKYTKQANQTLKKAVSTGTITQKQADSIAKKVKNGTMNISDYSDEMQEVISSYQEWYDKAQDCKDALQELKDSIKEYVDQLKELRETQRDVKIEMSETYTEIGTSSYAYSAT